MTKLLLTVGWAAIAGSAIVFVLAVRRWRPELRHSIAGSFSAFNFGVALVVAAAMGPNYVTVTTVAFFSAVAVAFLMLEMRLRRGNHPA
ncbi:MAG: hypothetical protein WEE89_07905 [Gemmatimonadota bacterium]